VNAGRCVQAIITPRRDFADMMVRTLLLGMVLVAASAGVAPAFQGGSPPPSGSAAAAAADVARVDESAAVDVPAPSAKAIEYYRTGNLLWLADQVWTLLVFVLILSTGFAATLRSWARRTGRNWFFTIAAYWILFTLVGLVADLPLGYYRDFVRPHQYGLSNQTLQKWVTDLLTTVVVTSIVGALIIWVPYLLLKKSPRRWWLYSGLALVPFVIVANLVAPIWVAPLYNRFEPMHDKALETSILAQASRAGIEGSRVFEVNKSVDTNTLNAYVAGLFNTRRIVIWDTTIRRMTRPELLFVMGHEMGHYVLNHVWKLVALSVVSLIVSLYAAYRLSGAIIRRYGSRMGFASLSDVASMPLLFALLTAVNLAITPVQFAVVRHYEHEADRFGLEITRFNHSAATAFVKLQTDALAIPLPGLLFQMWHGTHPTLGDRIDFANSYHPWHTGEALTYADRFKP
jgi:STE24 endopeptidase